MNKQFVGGFIAGGLCVAMAFWILREPLQLVGLDMAPIVSKKAKYTSPAVAAAPVPPESPPKVRFDPPATDEGMPTRTPMVAKMTMNGISLNELYEQNPNFLKLQRLNARRRLEKQWRALLDADRVAPALRDQILDKLAQKETLNLELRSAAVQRGEDPNADSINEATRQQAEGIVREINSLLGSERYASMQQMATKVEGVTRVMDNEVVPDFERLGIDYSQQQLNALTVSFLNYFKPAVNVNEIRRGAVESDEKLLGEASIYLLPAQLKALRDTLAARRQMQLISDDAMATAKKKSAG